MKAKLAISLFCTIAVTAGISGICHARVFSASGRFTSRLLQTLRAAPLYDTGITCNGKQGRMTATSVDMAWPALERLLASIAGKHPPTPDGKGTMLIYDVVQGSSSIHLIALQPGQYSRPVLLLFEFPDGNPGTPGPEAQPAWNDIPRYPGSKLKFNMTNNDNSTSFASFSTPDTAASVTFSMAELMRSDGWQPALPATGGPGFFAMYLKKEAVCCILASNGGSGDTVLSVIRKKIGAD